MIFLHAPTLALIAAAVVMRSCGRSALVVAFAAVLIAACLCMHIAARLRDRHG